MTTLSTLVGASRALHYGEWRIWRQSEMLDEKPVVINGDLRLKMKRPLRLLI